MSRRKIVLFLFVCNLLLFDANGNGIDANHNNTFAKQNHTKVYEKVIQTNGDQKDDRSLKVTDNSHEIFAKKQQFDGNKTSVAKVEVKNAYETNDDNINGKENEAKMLEKEIYAIDLYCKALSLFNKSKLNTKKAYTLLQESAKLNHYKSKELVAKSHLFGDNLPFNMKVAKTYFSSLSINESSSAQLFLGFMHSIGLGVNRSQEKASLHYTFSASNGNSLAQMAKAFRYMFGISELMSCESALNLYHRVATNVAQDVSISGGAILQNIRLLDEIENPDSVYQRLDTDFIHYYEFLANRGDIGAQVGLGQFYYNGGHGVTRDHTRALYYLRKASDAGNGNALALLGKMHFEGSDAVQQSDEIALQYFERAADKGNPMGQNGLGLMYLFGRGVDSDYSKAYHYFSMSARQGWVEGQLQLGLMYLNGLNVSRDYRMAIKYFSVASQTNHVLALFNLAQMHANGRGTVRSCNSAVHMFKNVAERGHWSSMFMEAHNDYRYGRITQAFIKYAFLSELGYESAQTNAAFILENHEINELLNKNERQTLALMYWTRSASQGYSYAHVKVGDYHYFGYGTKIDYQMAVYHYKKASQVGLNAQALFNLGFMYESGLGLKRDIRLAQFYYEKSAQTSSEAAIPVALATIKLKIICRVESFMELLFVMSKWLGPNWDFYLITLLVILLGFLIKYKLA